MAAMTNDLDAAVTAVLSAAQTAVTAQVEAQRAAEECKTMMEKIRSYEARRPIVKEVLREIESAVNIAPLEARVSALEQRQVVDGVSPSVPSSRFDEMDKAIAELRSRLSAPAHEVLTPATSDILDRMAALEDLVVESMKAPEALASQLRLTGELLEAMDRQARANRDADLRVLELHRQAGETAAQAQGGIATVVDAMRVDLESLTVAVEQLRNQINRRDGYVSGILRGRRAG